MYKTTKMTCFGHKAPVFSSLWVSRVNTDDDDFMLMDGTTLCSNIMMIFANVITHYGKQ